MAKNDEIKALDEELKNETENDDSADTSSEDEAKKTETAERKSRARTKAAAIKKVTIRLPLSKSEKDDVFVAVNGKRYQIKRGVAVEVPWNVAKVLERKEKMLEVAIAYEAEASAKIDELLRH